MRQITFSVTPEMEGLYYCMGDGVRSKPRSVEIVGENSVSCPSLPEPSLGSPFLLFFVNKMWYTL